MSLQSYDELPTALEAYGADPGEYKDILDRCRDFFSRYAEIETAILGEVPVQFPAHLFEGSEEDDPLAAGEAMAQREQERMPAGDLALDGMQVFLDREQFKVYRFAAPDHCPLLGFFLFDPEWGPLFAVNRTLHRGEADRVLARLYGHFLMDNDPYEIQLVWREEEEHSPSQVRATAFAAVFLIPERGLRSYMQAVSTEPLEVTPQLVEQLAVYFAVSPSLVVLRFVALGWIGTDAMEPLLQGVDPARTRVEAQEEGPFGHRFVRLALEAEARELIDLKTLARYLETSEEEAALWKARFRL